MTAARIRPFRAGDEPALAEICLRTADAGGDATGIFEDDAIWAHIWVLPYAEHHPDLAFVTEEEDGTVSGTSSPPPTRTPSSGGSARSGGLVTPTNGPSPRRRSPGRTARSSTPTGAARSPSPSPRSFPLTSTSTCCRRLRAGGGAPPHRDARHRAPRAGREWPPPRRLGGEHRRDGVLHTPRPRAAALLAGLSRLRPEAMTGGRGSASSTCR